MNAFEKYLAGSPWVRQTLRYAFRAFCEWLTTFELIVIFHALWMSASWLRNLTVREWLAEAAVEFAVALLCALLFGFCATVIWLAAGGARQSRSSQIAKAFLTAAAALLLLVVLLLANLKWAVQIGLAVPFPVRAAVVVVCLGLLVWHLSKQGRSDPGLDKVSETTQFLGRRSLVALVPFALSATLLNGVRWRHFDRKSDTNSKPLTGNRRNILLVTFDALAAQDMSLYGHKLATTPNLDRLAGNAIVFENMISASNFTTSSVTSILTGKTVASHGRFFNLVGRVSDRLKRENLGAELQRQGYVTGALVSNPYAHPNHIGLDDSFDFLPAPPERRLAGTDALYHVSHSDIGLTFSEATDGRARGLLLGSGLKSYDGTLFPPHLAFDEALKFIERAPRPYFLWIHLLAPHSPYDPPRPFLGRFLSGDEYSGLPSYRSSLLQTADPGSGGYYPAEMQREVDKVRLRYDEFIAYADDAFGKFIGRFDTLPGASETVVMVSSDHGENFDHGFWGHTDKNLWQPTIHVPLILKLPGARGGQRIAGTAGHVDIVPTLFDAAGLQPVSWTEGRSLRPMWEESEHGDRERVAELIDSPNNSAVTSGAVAIVRGHEKFVINVESGAVRLRDLKNDPNEMVDLSAREPQRVAKLRDAVLSRLNDINACRG